MPLTALQEINKSLTALGDYFFNYILYRNRKNGQIITKNKGDTKTQLTSLI